MPLETIIALLLGLLAVVALYAAVRVPGRGPGGRRAAGGYWLFAAGAAIEAVNLLTGYSAVLAGVSTLAIVLGLVQITRGWARRDLTA